MSDAVELVRDTLVSDSSDEAQAMGVLMMFVSAALIVGTGFILNLTVAAVTLVVFICGGIAGWTMIEEEVHEALEGADASGGDHE